ncbi:MAG: bifunctional oligoribonuclease/PAP phosphatase NrnA [Desulfobacteraceae bacterium]|nr:bifunctional oligoribonuclease/PAP phosphatase NrnA [Desulfobacteraceae bacterium]MCB9494816.1 bifunctional oligoribonuclease/PAP phosphatase NrnA [Desulfobacteraceae bacterium]
MVKTIFDKSQNILITSHLHPDGDALGSMLALGRALEKKGKNIYLYNESCIPKIFSFLPGIEKINRGVPDHSKFDTAVILDCSETGRTGKCKRILKNIPEIINIDHHRTNTNFGTFKIVEPKASATAEIVYRLIKDLGIEICNEIAYSIYTGIFTDTGSFRFSNTNAEAFSICREMLDYGVSPHKVAQQIYGSYSLGRIKLINMVLDSIEISDNKKMSLMILTQNMLKQTDTKREDVSELINYAEHIEDVKVAALIKEGEKEKNKDQCYHVSLRSDGTIDVSKIAFSYGGGGHETAAGFSTTIPFPELKKEIMAIADRI